MRPGFRGHESSRGGNAVGVQTCGRTPSGQQKHENGRVLFRETGTLQSKVGQGVPRVGSSHFIQ